LAAIALENLHQVAALIGVIFIVVAAVAAFRWHVAPKRKLLALGIGVVCILGVNAIEGSVESRPPVKSKTVSAAPQDLPKSHNEVALDQPIHVEIDLPKLALARKTAIDKILGPPTKTQNETNTLDLPISVVQYKRAECTFFRDRLVSIIYKFKKRPSTAADALEWSGLPRSAVSLDNEHANHLPYRAFYAPNPDYRNPIRCCGLLLQWVSIPEDLGEIHVNYANSNYHFKEWPVEIQSEWSRAGGATNF
jgi:hypothetical protein